MCVFFVSGMKHLSKALQNRQRIAHLMGYTCRQLSYCGQLVGFAEQFLCFLAFRNILQLDDKI
ncbi:hypothetical protein D3C73_1612260 [compost metagenome]